ncbi:MAG: hypothetical protein HXX16_13425 [Bacteroidales bacterium]|nr:hypothetical protein [Bacteroidales bacterium]
MSNIKLFESKQIRTEWSETNQKWYFAIIDVVEVLTESSNPLRYWSDLKRKLNSEEFSQLYEIIVQLKMISTNRKYITAPANSNLLPIKFLNDNIYKAYNVIIIQTIYSIINFTQKRKTSYNGKL